METLQPPLPDYLPPEVLEQMFSDDYVTRVRLARRMSPENKLRSGVDLFSLACWHLRWAAHILCPRASAEERKALVREFLNVAKKLDDPEPS